MTPIITRTFLLLIPTLLASLAGCTPRTIPPDGKLHVVCTTSLIADAVQRVGGDRVTVECLMGPGVDPHRYNASAGDIQKLTAARIVFHHGLHLEGKMGDVLEQERSGQKSVVITSRLTDKQLRASDGGDGPHDPHVWFDPTLWADCLPLVVEALKDADPEHQKEYDTAAKQYRDELLAVDRELEKLAHTLPAERRKLVTSHDAFGYFGARYGFEVHGLQGVSTASEPSTKTVSELAEFLAKNKIAAIFGETSVPTKGLLAVMDATEQRYGHKVRLIGGDLALYSDALGEPGSPGENYLGMIRHNMTTIVTALKDPK
ncbi:metal ABC transporter solute-binding protein, Zn/Mn family [Limnoglobus roseus]|uniref:Periplasmic solute-binding protein n=1 Tax=Limnoglobus roseus TaxID=2598579 RepID=A0A5C1AID0_9BACT|nr:zinc ABC transporter substrate-binding protein [Limnoglobus roseus]QEL18931.1 periplasmic solute-binding protein [Limnoglobus roseus]